MTRWARAGNSQKHTKMPGNATPWQEFAKNVSFHKKDNRVDKKYKFKNKNKFENKKVNNQFPKVKFSEKCKANSSKKETAFSWNENKGKEKDENNYDNSLYEINNSMTVENCGMPINEAERNFIKTEMDIKYEENSKDVIANQNRALSEISIKDQHKKPKKKRKFQEMLASQSSVNEMQNDEEYNKPAESRGESNNQIESDLIENKKNIKKEEKLSNSIVNQSNVANLSETRVLSKNQKRKLRIRRFKELQASQSGVNKIQNDKKRSTTAEKWDKTNAADIEGNTIKYKKNIDSDLICSQNNRANAPKAQVLSKNQIRKAKRREWIASHSGKNKVQNDGESKDNTLNTSNSSAGEDCLGEKNSYLEKLQKNTLQSGVNRIQNDKNCSRTADNWDKTNAAEIEGNTVKYEKNIDSDLIRSQNNRENAPKTQVLSKNQIRKAKRREWLASHSGKNKLQNDGESKDNTLNTSNSSADEDCPGKKNSYLEKLQNDKKVSRTAENWDQTNAETGNTVKYEKDIDSDLIHSQNNRADAPKRQVLSKNQIIKAKKKEWLASHSGKNKVQNDGESKDDKLNTTNSSADCLGKKTFYLEKLQKERKRNGITLLPSKIEDKIYKIKKRLREKGMPTELIKNIIRKERRTQELNLRKITGTKPCFNCRRRGHLLSECPLPLGKSNQETGICFKCGSTEHTSYQCRKKVTGYPLAKCFVCKEQGHISKDCPQNDHGVYPKGGNCNLCGNINHLKKDCPSLHKKKEEIVTLHTINETGSIDAEIMETSETIKRKVFKKSKIVKF